MASQQSFRESVFTFFEKPKTFIARLVHGVILTLIILTAGSLVIEYGYENIFGQYENYFAFFDTFVLGVFTVEYLLRIWAAPNRIKFFFNFYNLIDFFAVAPMYLGFINTAGLRSLRILRLMRLSRILRVFRLFRYGKFFNTIFGIKNTILEKILPVVVFFTVLKFCIYLLESKGLWVADYNLETMFAVVGFVLGVVLSQKIGVAYTKFILLEDSVTKIHGFLISLSTVLKTHNKGKKPSKALKEWTETFHDILLREKPKHAFYEINENLYKELHKLIEHSPAYAEVIRVYSRLNEEASFILNRMDALTPPAYDQILHRVTIIYSFLLVIFMPGVIGIVATLVTTYVLYGMYQVTDDMDNAMTHLEDHLINADINDLVTLQKKLS